MSALHTGQSPAAGVGLKAPARGGGRGLAVTQAPRPFERHVLRGTGRRSTGAFGLIPVGVCP
jgi:hypothetical protein